MVAFFCVQNAAAKVTGAARDAALKHGSFAACFDTRTNKGGLIAMADNNKDRNPQQSQQSPGKAGEQQQTSGSGQSSQGKNTGEQGSQKSGMSNRERESGSSGNQR
jgi:hypothetical protein